MEAAIRVLEERAKELRQNVDSYTKLETERRAALEATQAIRASNEQSLAQVMAALDVLKANVGHKPPPQVVPRQQRAALLTPCPNCQQSHWTDEICRFPPPAPVPPVCPACDHAHERGKLCIGVAVGAGGGVVKVAPVVVVPAAPCEGSAGSMVVAGAASTTYCADCMTHYPSHEQHLCPFPTSV